MQQYIIRRLLLGSLSIFAVSVLIFLLVRVFPVDPATAILAMQAGETGSIDPKKVAELQHEMGLNRPLYQQYLVWIGQLARFDFGDSYAMRISIGGEIARRLPFTIQLAVLTMLFGSAVAVTLGVVGALNQDRPLDQVIRVLSVLGLTMPTFWSSTLIILMLVYTVDWIPPLGYVPIWQAPQQALVQLVWPVLALGIYYIAVIARLTRSSMLEVLRADYVRTAYSKGLVTRAVVVRHALRNALLPVVTIIGLQFAFLMSGAIIVETVFALPGLGAAFVEAIRWRDYLYIQNQVMLYAVMVLAINLVVDLAYSVIDPRIRLR